MSSPIARRLSWLRKADTSTSAVIQTVLARAGLLVGNLLTGIIVARALAPAGRGEQAAMTLWPVIFSRLFGLGLPLAVVYNIRRDPQRARTYFSTAFVCILLLGLVGAIVGAIVLPFAMSKYAPTIVRAAQIFMVFTIQALTQYLLQATLEARGRFDVSNQLRYVPIVLTIIALAAFAAFHRLTPIVAVLCYNVPATIVTALSLLALRDYFPLRFGDLRSNLAALLSFGLKSYGNDLVNTFSWQIEQSLLIGLLSAADLGLFAVATSISRMLNVFHSSFIVVVMPKATELREKSRIVDLTNRAARISTFVTACAAVLLATVTPLFLPLFYGHRYDRAIHVAQLLLLDVLMQGMVLVLSQAFIALGRPATMTIFQMAGIACSVPLLVLLIPRLGVVGAAIAFIAASAIRLVFALASFPILLKEPLPQLFIRKHDFAFIVNRLRMRKPA